MKVRGAAALAGKLKKNANLDDVRKTVKMNGSEMQRAAQRHAPVATGNLKRNISIHQEDGGFSSRVKSKAEYAPYQEYGTRYQSGTPHVRPAFNNQKNRFLQDMKRLMK